MVASQVYLSNKCLHVYVQFLVNLVLINRLVTHTLLHALTECYRMSQRQDLYILHVRVVICLFDSGEHIAILGTCISRVSVWCFPEMLCRYNTFLKWPFSVLYTCIFSLSCFTCRKNSRTVSNWKLQRFYFSLSLLLHSSVCLLLFTCNENPYESRPIYD